MDYKPESFREVLIYGDDFWEFYNQQAPKVKRKINWTIGVIRDLERVPEQCLKHIEGTDLYEIRVMLGNNIFRIFCFFDKGRLVVLLNAFQKKTQKTPKGEIEKALNLKRKYYEEQGK
ncbi:type II toxin-antitoxin system RelE/ParE family toxin [Cytophagales bacterium LB-30]|uniref:Type II toxin-antitoxin system RelE/ParE family toxin n=1 Tax=Shiella aurantiaca TaxID=3058365 RepID=A0ABT8F626_9BACT|nr:type II toxin-antitoxin system RelE/ParE family toxin [Shiella aurantiaca]MDN4165426.1 type II toxin-antitoxin system RelE/ParE family toxin [Shiella aurantiaca]